MAEEYQLKVIGWIESDLTQVEKAPSQGVGSGQEAWLVLGPEFSDGLDGIQAGDQLLVLTWLQFAERWPLNFHRTAITSCRPRVCLAPVRPTARIQSGFTRWKCWQFRQTVCTCAIWRQSTAPRWWT